MSVACTHCGEVLLGAVNRCWRCGQPFIPQTGVSQSPPVRHALGAPDRAAAQAIELPPIMAELATPASTPTIGAGIQSTTPFDILASPVEITTAAAPSTPTAESTARRSGSPFAGGQVLLAAADAGVLAPRPAVITYIPPAAPAWQPSHPAAIGGAIASVMLGVLGLAVGWYTAWTLITCVLGVAMGVWGVYSTKRALAMFGIGLCCLALLVTGVCAATRWYAAVHGGSPFDSIDEPLEMID